MADVALGSSFHGKFRYLSLAEKLKACTYDGRARRKWLFLASAMLLTPLAFAQNSPQVTGVDPTSGKVNDTVTLAGQNLGKTTVSAVFLSDDKNDYKVTVVDQSDEKIVVKIPQVKSGDYNVSVQVGDKIYIKPVKIKVEE